MNKKEKEYKARNMSGKVSILFIVVVVGIIGICLAVKNLVSFDDSDVSGEDTSSGDEVIVSGEYYISYNDEEYISSNSAGYVISTSRRNLPVIVNEGRQDIADKIVDSLTLISDDVWDNSIKVTADEVVSSYENVGEDMDMGVSYMISTGVVTDNRLSFVMEMSGNFGGVSWDGESGYNYDAVNGAILTFDNIANNYEGLYNAIYDDVKAYIDNQDYVNDLGNDDNGNWEELLSDIIPESGNWYFTEDGIRVIIPRNSIGPSSVGNIIVDISKDNINEYLKDEYKIV